MDTKARTSPRRTMGAYTPMFLLLLLAALAIEEGLRLLLAVDPAAQADMAGWYVLVLGLILAGTSVYTERPQVTSGNETPANSGEGEPEVEYIRPHTPRRNVVVCLLLIAVYALLLSIAGYVIAGFVVVFAFLRAISGYGWVRTAVLTVAINAVAITLFELSGVVLPSGILPF